ncbi:MAG: AMP-binding protein [Pseudomonadota bacterium]
MTDTIHIPARTDGPSADDIASAANSSVLAALLKARNEHGGGVVALEDGDKRKLTYTELVRAIAALSRVIKREVPSQNVGVLLPSSVAGVVTFFAVLAAGKVPAMLNFTAGEKANTAACHLAKVGAVLTADRFLEIGKLHPLADALAKVAPVIKLEDMRTRVGKFDKAFAAAAAPLGLFPKLDPDSPAAIVFTSGSEGHPKGVVLTHRNMLANIAQVEAVIPLDRVRVMLNPLPMFHSYGLVPGTVLPLVLGRKLVLHPSPLRIREVVDRIAETQANILFATDTFLRQYVRAAGDGMLSCLEFAVCGAERVRPETRETVTRRFGFKVLEGYGVTETSPVLAVNLPDDIRDGTVGQMFHGLDARLDPVEGLAEGHRLSVRGPNVMAGYLQPDGSITQPPDGYHDTGDVVSIDGEGFITILGRLKRFAKIGGEMTSLVTVENIAGQVWPDALHAASVVNLPGRGEAIVLLTEQDGADASQFLDKLKADGIPQRYMPFRIIGVAAVPVLGSGKTDFVAAQHVAQTLLQQDAA